MHSATTRSPITVEETMRLNNELRRETVGDSDLIKLGDLANDPPAYENGPGAVLTVDPEERPVLLTQEEFNSRFQGTRVYQNVLERLFRIPNLVLCGGAVFRVFCGDGDMGDSDMDWFIVGLDPNDEVALWRKVDEFLDVFRETGECEYCPYHDHTAVRINKNVITVKSDCEDCHRQDTPKQQLILRVYPEVGAIIQAFDVDPCCMAYDGSTTYLTHAAARALVTKRMILDPSRRSLTYEKRLIKYMNRGVDLYMPHMAMSPAMQDSLVSMPRMEFVVIEFDDDVAHVDIQPTCADTVSDYDFMEEFDNQKFMCYRKCFLYCVEEFMKGNNDKLLRLESLEKTRELLQKIIERGYMAVEDVISIYALRNLYYDLENANSKMSLCNIGGLGLMTKYMGMSNSAAKKILDLVQTHKVVDLKDVVRTLQEKSLGRYESKMKDKLNMWIKTDPGRQWTASINPAFEEPEKYYGEYYCRNPAPNSNSGVGDDDGPSPDDDVCMMCHEVIKPGETNIMVLHCGHKMHMMRMKRKCAGGFDWIANYDKKCPMCRCDPCETTPATSLPDRRRSASALMALASVAILEEDE